MPRWQSMYLEQYCIEGRRICENSHTSMAGVPNTRESGYKKKLTPTRAKYSSGSIINEARESGRGTQNAIHPNRESSRDEPDISAGDVIAFREKELVVRSGLINQRKQTHSGSAWLGIGLRMKSSCDFPDYRLTTLPVHFADVRPPWFVLRPRAGDST